MKLPAVIIGAVLIASVAAAAQDRPSSQPAVRFQPKLKIGAEAPPLYTPRADPRPAGARRTHQRATHGSVSVAGQHEREVLCGTTVIHKSDAVDPKMIDRSNRGTGAAIRRITPPVCSK